MDFKSALELNNEEEIIHCVKNGSNLNKLINYKYPIFYLIKNNNIHLIKLFLQYGADVNIFSSECYQTPIIYASQLNNNNIIKLLISYGASVSFVGMSSIESDYTLNMAHFNIHSELVYWYYNWNPFFSAYDYEYIGAVKYVLKNGLFKMKSEYFNYFKNKNESNKQKKIKYMLRESMKKWNPERHILYHKNIQNNIYILFHIKNSLIKKNIILPLELWYFICKFL